MPAIFSERDKGDLYERMIAEGCRLVQERGIRKLRVEDVTRAVGIAKGTFYSFFPSKERFVYAMMTEGRQDLMDLLGRLRDERGALGRDELRTWLQAMWRSERNVYRIVTLDDYEWLMAHLEPEASFDPAKDMQVMGPSPSCWRACAPAATGACSRTSRRPSPSRCSAGPTCTPTPSRGWSTRSSRPCSTRSLGGADPGAGCGKGKYPQFHATGQTQVI